MSEEGGRDQVLLPTTPTEIEAKTVPASHREGTDRQTLCTHRDSRHLPSHHMGEEMETLGGACPFLDRSTRLEAGPGDKMD